MKKRLAVVNPAPLGSHRIGVDPLTPAAASATPHIPAVTAEADLKLQAAATGSTAIHLPDALIARAHGINPAAVNPTVRRLRR